MPSTEQMKLVGETCSEFDAALDNVSRSCETCVHWGGEEGMCGLDIFLEQLTSLDQT